MADVMQLKPEAHLEHGWVCRKDFQEPVQGLANLMCFFLSLVFFCSQL